MDFLEGVPSPHGIDILKQELFEKVKKFELVNNADEAYHSGDVHRVFFDSNGVLTVTFVIPKEDHFTVWNKAIRITEADGQEIISYLTPQIQFVTGVGGEQVAKLPVSGEAGEVVFKADEYLTEYEAEELLMLPVIENLSFITAVAHHSLKDFMKQVGA